MTYIVALRRLMITYNTVDDDDDDDDDGAMETVTAASTE